MRMERGWNNWYGFMFSGFLAIRSIDCSFLRCENWPLTLRKEYVLRVFEKRFLEEYLDRRRIK
jgi:hypothetical protein